MKKKTHCARGHKFAGKNLFVDSRGWRQCRQCLEFGRRKRLGKLTPDIVSRVKDALLAGRTIQSLTGREGEKHIIGRFIVTRPDLLAYFRANPVDAAPLIAMAEANDKRHYDAHRIKICAPAGREKIHDGRIHIAVDDASASSGTRYVLKHRLLWERQHGAIPGGHVLKCKGDDPFDTDPSNWTLVPVEIAPCLNRAGIRFVTAPDEVKMVILAAARLEHALRQNQKKR